MLQVQLPFVDRQSLRGSYLGGGCYGRVWRHPDGDVVIKQSHSHDGTLAWVYWCKRMQDMGHMLPGMPKVHKLALTEQGWLAVMEYVPHGCNTLARGHAPYKVMAQGKESMFYLASVAPDHALYSTLEAFVKAFQHVGQEGGLDDLHPGNIMMREDGSLVVLDPSSEHIIADRLPLMFEDDSASFTLH